MKVLFIGGTGNISTASSCLAVEKGIELWHINRGKSVCGVHGVRTITCDVTNSAALETALAPHKWDCVVNWIAFNAKDVERDIALFSGKTKHYIYISSGSCYDLPQHSPVITENSPLGNPYWQYSRDKIAGEQALMRAHIEKGFPGTIVRPSHTYSTIIPITLGGGNKYNAVNRMKLGKPTVVHGDGTSLWVVTHAEDFALGLVGLLNLEAAIGEAVHITSDEVLTWNQIYRHVGAALGLEPNLIHVASDTICALEPSYTGTLLGDKSHSVMFDNSKIRSLVPSFVPIIPFSEGIRTTIEWFEASSDRQYIDPDTEILLDKLTAIATT